MLVLTKGLIDWLQTHKGAKPDDDEHRLRELAAEALSAGELTAEQMKSLQDSGATRSKHVSNAPSPTKVFGGTGNIEVGQPGGYRTEKSIGRHSRMGCEVLDERGRPAMTSSEKEHALTGVFLKTLAGRSGLPVTLNDHERELWGELVSEKTLWAGLVGGQWRDEIAGLEVKALLSDSTSGGLEVNPQFFDQNIITFPLLGGELYPWVDVREVPRGSRVEGASIGNPTVSWGTAEGTPVSLFDTDSLVAEINTSVYPVTVAVEVGRDFLSDAAADVGRVLEANIGERLKAELDRVIAVGNGTSEPTGIFTQSGISSVSSDNGTGGAPTIGDFESLLFAVGKQYRTSRRCAFISNDTTYRRVRTIPVDASNDQRFVIGMDVDRGSGASIESYSALGRPWRIQNDLSNSRAAFGDLSRYRMYRRLGMRIEWHTQGETLARRNTALLVVRARFGGRPVDVSAFAKMTDLQS